jgi:TRAP-type C4-dicarboxylate transport system permease small subunit
VTFGIALSVFYRWATGRTVHGSIELPGIAILFLTFLTAAYVSRSDGHVRLEVIDEYVSKRVLRWLDVVSSATGVLLALGLTFAATRQIIEDIAASTETATALGLPRWMVLSAIPLGSLLLGIEQIRQFSRAVSAGGTHDVDDPYRKGAPHV